MRHSVSHQPETSAISTTDSLNLPPLLELTPLVDRKLSSVGGWLMASKCGCANELCSFKILRDGTIFYEFSFSSFIWHRKLLGKSRLFKLGSIRCGTTKCSCATQALTILAYEGTFNALVVGNAVAVRNVGDCRSALADINWNRDEVTAASLATGFVTVLLSAVRFYPKLMSHDKRKLILDSKRALGSVWEKAFVSRKFCTCCNL